MISGIYLLFYVRAYFVSSRLSQTHTHKQIFACTVRGGWDRVYLHLIFDLWKYKRIENQCEFTEKPFRDQSFQMY